MKVNKKKCLKLVIEQIENMLYNNKDNGVDSITESFVDWCENGSVFYYLMDKDISADKRINEKEKEYCIELMNRIAPLVDNITNELYNIFEEIEEE